MDHGCETGVVERDTQLVAFPETRGSVGTRCMSAFRDDKPRPRTSRENPVAGLILRYHPLNSADFDSVEMAFAKLKACRAAAARTFPDL